jgi:hypothetical protein
LQLLDNIGCRSSRWVLHLANSVSQNTGADPDFRILYIVVLSARHIGEASAHFRRVDVKRGDYLDVCRLETCNLLVPQANRVLAVAVVIDTLHKRRAYVANPNDGNPDLCCHTK